MNSYHNEEGYLQMLSDTLKDGEFKITRNGHVYSRFGLMISFHNINNSFPLLTTKRMFIKGIVEELLWFLRGSTDAKELQSKGVHIWDGNSSRSYLDSIGLQEYAEGQLGPIYGWQWRNYGKSYNCETNSKGIDQIKYIIEELQKTDNSRRAVLTAWNPQQLQDMALPPCHILYSFYKDSNGLSCMMTMRSSDLFLGLPFNIASTALLTSILAYVLHLKPHCISITLTDAHIYEEHVTAVNTQLKNTIKNSNCQLQINQDAPHFESTIEEKINWIENLKYEDFIFHNYLSDGPIKAVMK